METGVIENKRTVFAGTKDEFISYVAEQILMDCQKEKSEFKGIDFGSSARNVSDMEKLYFTSSEWCGIAALPNYFEAYANRQFACDCYGGGGCFGICDICTDNMDIESVKKDVAEMLRECLDISGSIIIWENKEVA